MRRSALIACRVSPEVKARVRVLAERQGITESALLKRLLDVALQGAGTAESSSPPGPERMSRNARLYVRLAVEDRRLLRERSQARGMPSATYVSLMVRAHLRGGAPLPKAEYLALRHCIVELGTIGRNINQIARSANQGTRAGQMELSAMLDVAESLTEHIKELLIANQRSWEDRDVGNSN